MTKITDQDVKALERYEQLLFRQNRTAFLKMQLGGVAILKAKDRDELNELVKIKKKKHMLIKRLSEQKEESKFKEMESRLTAEVMRGIRRSQVS